MTDADLEDLARKGIEAHQAGDLLNARDAFLAIAEAGRASTTLWAMIAEVTEALGDDTTQHKALDALLAANPRDVSALTMKGDLYLKAGDDRAAMGWYNNALHLAADAGPFSAEMKERLARAEQAAHEAAARFEAHLHKSVSEVVNDGAMPDRFAEALAILTGRQSVQLQQPTSFYFPGLPQIAFYDRADFDWVAELEAAYPDILAEVETVMADQDDILPYVQADPSRPNRGHALLNDARWSAYHFFENGLPINTHHERCPKTITALSKTPMPFIAGRSPMALFSILKPKTHIPPHHGMLNTRLICHLPLIVPDNCQLRVGNHVKTVEPGKVMIFDDSLEHEAWNDSDAVRVILLFEIWRPELSALERQALTALFESVSLYPSSAA